MIRSTLLILQHIFVALVCVLSLPYAIALTAEPFLLDGLYGGFAVVGLFVWSLLFSPIVFGLVYWLSRGLLKKKRIYNPRKVGIQLSSFSLGLILLLCLQTVAAPYGLRLHDSYHDRHFSNRVIDYHFFGAHVGLFGVFAAIAAYLSYRLLCSNNASNNNLNQQQLANNNHSSSIVFQLWKPLFVLLPLALYYALIFVQFAYVPQQPPFIG